MRDQFKQWRGKMKTGSMHVGRWIRRHTVLAAVALLLTVLISPRTVQGQLPSPCCAILAAGLGTINSTLGSVIGGGLQAINTVLSDISNFEQTGGGTFNGTVIAHGAVGIAVSTVGNVNIVTVNGRLIDLGASVTLVDTVINVPAP